MALGLFTSGILNQEREQQGGKREREREREREKKKTVFDDREQKGEAKATPGLPIQFSQILILIDISSTFTVSVCVGVCVYF